MNEYRPDTVSPPTDTLLETWHEGGLHAVLRVPLRFWYRRVVRWLAAVARTWLAGRGELVPQHKEE